MAVLVFFLCTLRFSSPESFSQLQYNFVFQLIHSGNGKESYIVKEVSALNRHTFANCQAIVAEFGRVISEI